MGAVLNGMPVACQIRDPTEPAGENAPSLLRYFDNISDTGFVFVEPHFMIHFTIFFQTLFFASFPYAVIIEITNQVICTLDHGITLVKTSEFVKTSCRRKSGKSFRYIWSLQQCIFIGDFLFQKRSITSAASSNDQSAFS